MTKQDSVIITRGWEKQQGEMGEESVSGALSANGDVPSCVGVIKFYFILMPHQCCQDT